MSINTDFMCYVSWNGKKCLIAIKRDFKGYKIRFFVYKKKN